MLIRLSNLSEPSFGLYLFLNPFILKINPSQISRACSLTKNITSHSMKNLLFIAYSDERSLFYQIWLNHLHIFSSGRMYFLDLGVKWQTLSLPWEWSISNFPYSPEKYDLLCDDFREKANQYIVAPTLAGSSSFTKMDSPTEWTFPVNTPTSRNSVRAPAAFMVIVATVMSWRSWWSLRR